MNAFEENDAKKAKLLVKTTMKVPSFLIRGSQVLAS